MENIWTIISEMGFTPMEFKKAHLDKHGSIKTQLLMATLPMRDMKVVTFTTSHVVIDATFTAMMKPCIIDADADGGSYTFEHAKPTFLCYKGDEFYHCNDNGDTFTSSVKRFISRDSDPSYTPCVVCLDDDGDAAYFKTAACTQCFAKTCFKCIRKGKLEKCPICRYKCFNV